ncbi:MAG TPA: O-antigen ligase family protein [Gemmataceae bacterium]
MKGLIFTYLLTYGGAAASLFSPFTGLLVYVCFAILKPEALWHWSVPVGNYSRTVALALLAGWALHGFGNWNFGRARPIVYCLLGYWAWMVLSAFGAAAPERAWAWVEAQSKVLLPCLAGITLIDSTRRLKQLAWVIVLSQGYLAYEFNMAYLAGSNRLEKYGFANMDNNSVAVALVTCCGLGLFLALSTPRWWMKVLALGPVALMIHAVLFSFSRGGMLGLVVTGVVAFLLIPKRPVHYLFLVLTVLGGLRLAGPEVTEEFLSSFADPEQRDVSAESRIELWGICLEVMRDRPLTGLGPWHFPYHAQEFGLTPMKEAHSLWLQTGAELGVPGLLFLLGFYLICLRRLWPVTRESYPAADPWHRDAARMVIAALSGFIVSAQFVSLAGLETPFYITLIGAGVLKLESARAAARAGGDRRR